MASIRERLAGQAAEVQTKINTATAEDLAPTLKQEGDVVVSSNALFETAMDVAINSGEEVKKSDSGARSPEAQEAVQAIVKGDNELEYPVNLTQVFEADISAKQAVKAIKVYVKEYRKEYSKSKIKPQGFAFGTTAEDKVCIAMDRVDAINRKLNDIKSINKDSGYAIYDIESEARRLVATDPSMLAFLSKTTDVEV